MFFMQSFYFKKLKVVPKTELKLLCPLRSTLNCLLTIKNRSKNQPFHDKVMSNNVSFSNLLQITTGFSLQITTNLFQIATGITNYGKIITNYNRAQNFKLSRSAVSFLLALLMLLFMSPSFLPPQHGDFAQKAKSRGGTLVA